MAWIRILGEDEAGDELRAALRIVKGKRGKLSNMNPADPGAETSLQSRTSFGDAYHDSSNPTEPTKTPTRFFSPV